MRLVPLFWVAAGRIFPELSFFKTDEDRATCIKTYVMRGKSDGIVDWKQSVLVAVLTLVLASAAVMAVAFLFHADWSIMLLLPCLFVFVPIVGAGVSLAWRGHLRGYLRRELVARGIPICLECGYDLRAQTEPRCPECGTPFDRKLLEPGKSPRPPGP